ncbi:RraA family protein [Nonomuraea sp. NBC_01738]|uniref:RraA family protein n=1 Tax=Nonomuraea sp. NBC_01738 TaxID=2976003 RepID=UPI002E1267CF|nr:RraA family protein [Nonomuraea sp. NBC_01738]
MSFDERVTAAQVSDSLDESGLRHQVLDAGIRPLAQGMRAVGPARTVQFAPTIKAGPDPYDDMIEFIDSIRPGEVIVISSGDFGRSAYWGELFSAAAKGRGASGVVCDSFARDRAKVLDLDFPVFCRGTRPIDYRARMRVVATQTPVLCGGVVISPGDVVVAEDDGIVSVPADLREKVSALANARAAKENDVLTDLLAGASLREVWDRYGVL